MFLRSPALLLTADVEDGSLEIGFIISWGLFIPLLLISQKVRFLDPLEEKISRNYFSAPHGFAQLLSAEGACVTCFPFRPIVILLLEMTEAWCRYLNFKAKFSREVVKKGCLCNINVWRRKSGNSMEGFFSHLSCISRIFRPECSFDRKESQESLYTGSWFSSPISWGPGTSKRILQICKKLHNQSKTRITILCSMSPHSRTTRKHWFNRYQISFLDFSSMQGISRRE